MGANDPFDFITELCHVSSSQEERLRRCRFAMEPYEQEDNDSGELPVASTGIMMVSPPDTPVDSHDETAPLDSQHDVFQTPPEESFPLASSQNLQQQPIVTTINKKDEDHTEEIAGDDEETVAADLGIEPEVGISEEVREAHNKEVIHCEYMRSGFPFKRLKFWDNNNYGFLTPNPLSQRERTLDRFVKSMEKLKSKSKRSNFYDRSLGLVSSREGINARGCSVQSPQKCSTEEVMLDTDDGNVESCGESAAKRKLEFSTEVLQSEFLENNVVLGYGEGRGNGEAKTLSNAENACSVKRSIVDIDKFRYVGSSKLKCRAKEIDVHVKRALPMSICGNKEDAGENEMECGCDVLSPKKFKAVTLLDVLRMLGKDDKYDPSLENLSILEAVKRRGMRFP